MSDNNSSSNNIHTKTVFIFDADDGMTLSKDVLNSDGSLIAASGTKLDMDMIAKISANHILEIEIIDKDYTEPVRPVENDNSTYYEKVRNSKEFKAFCKEYNEGISDLKSQLNDIVNRNADVDVDELLTYPLSLMNTYSNKLQMFDMLHSLRQFDDLTYAHSVNVALVASIIGEWLGYSEEDVHVLTLCGLLHDIGKVRIPRKILEKPGKLTPTEFEVMKAHVNEGYDIIKDNLKPGDILINVSDGILDISKSNNGKVSWLEEYLKNINGDPRELSEKILKKAKKLYCGFQT